MKKIFLLVLLMGVALCQAVAQQDAKAESILSKMADSYRKAGGISLTFGGTQHGKLLLKGDKFCLESGGIKTWFPGGDTERQSVCAADILQEGLQLPLRGRKDASGKAGT